MNRSLLTTALLASLANVGNADLPRQPEPMSPDEINRQRWWLAFCHEIEAIGGIVVGGPHEPIVNEHGELNVKVPKNRIRDAARIVQKFATQDPTKFRE